MSSVKVSGSRTLRKGSKKNSHNGKKNSRKGSKKNMDFSSILNDMGDEYQPQENQMQQMPQMQQMQQMPQMPQMEMGGMGMMPGMAGMAGMGGMGMMPNMDPGAMAQMAMPNMGVPQMSLGSKPENVDPLHLHSFVPQHQGANINNFGADPSQLMSGAQINQQLSGRQEQSGGGYFKAYDAFISKFM
jgi:hypothetical protein